MGVCCVGADADDDTCGAETLEGYGLDVFGELVGSLLVTAVLGDVKESLGAEGADKCFFLARVDALPELANCTSIARYQGSQECLEKRNIGMGTHNDSKTHATAGNLHTQMAESTSSSWNHHMVTLAKV